MTQLDVRGAVKFFGGPAELRRRLAAADSKITVKAIEKWHERNSIPGVWLVRLSQLARTQGRNFDISDFMRHGERNGDA